MGMREYTDEEGDRESIVQLILSALKAHHTCVYSMCLTDGVEVGYSLATTREGAADWLGMAQRIKDEQEVTLLHAVRVCSLNEFIRCNNIAEGMQ